jgi:hypothetical protein
MEHLPEIATYREFREPTEDNPKYRQVQTVASAMDRGISFAKGQPWETIYAGS